MTIGQFLRITAHNFRVFWSASFSGGSGPLMIEGPGEGKLEAEPAVETETEAEKETETETAEVGEKVVAAEIDGANDSSESRPEENQPEENQLVEGSSAAESTRVEMEVAVELGDPGIDVVSVTEGQPPAGEESVEAPAVAADAAGPDGVEADDPVLPAVEDAAADLESGTESAGLAEEDDAVHEQAAADAGLVQAELGIQPTDDPLAADIMVESHGKRLGLTQLIESLLFVSDEPVDAVQLAKALDVTLESVEAGLRRLDKLYHVTGRGLRLQAREGQYSLVTAPEAAGAIEDFLNLDLTTKLSGPALETLAVVAYRQPVTRLQIEAVRGVDCAGVLRSMTQRGLIEEVGRLETVGRPILYGVTDLFMQHFGLMDLAELPPLETQDEDMLWAATQLAALEDQSGETEDAAS